MQSARRGFGQFGPWWTYVSTSNPSRTADYLPASASAHWFLRWTGNPQPAHRPSDLPLLSLVSQVPEEAEEDARMRAAVLDAAAEAAASELTGRPARLTLHDD